MRVDDGCEHRLGKCQPARSQIDLERWTSHHTLRDGTRIRIRPLCASDREREIAFIQSLSERTRYLRMMSPLRYLSPHLLEQLMTVDYRGSMAFAATVGAADAERFIGLVRYGATDEPATVELAITVTDAWQRHGVAKLLIHRLLEYATEQGISTVVGWVLYENMPMLDLARACGFRIRIAAGQGAIQITRKLDPVTVAGTAPLAGSRQ